MELVSRVRKPVVGAPDGEKSPALFLLHGVGSDENDLLGLASFLDTRFFVISLRAPLSHPPGYGWYRIDFTPTGIVADESAAPHSRDRIVESVVALTETYDLNPTKVFLMGFSQGAAMSLYTALTRPGLAAGIVIMSGRLLEAVRTEAHESIAIPTLVVHGTRDPVLPIGQGRDIRDFLSENAPRREKLTYAEYPMAHEVSEESLAKIAGWLRDRLPPGA